MSVVPILNQGASEERAENARMSNFVGAIAIKDLVKSTLGPKGMDKLLQSTTNLKEVTITNDGATILKSIAAENAAAKILINVSMTQDSDVGDGTTSVVILCGELLSEAEKLIDKKIHPQVIIEGFRNAQKIAYKALVDSSYNNFDDKGKFEADLLNMALTTLSSKILSQDKGHFAKIAVDAVIRQGDDVNINSIGFLKKVGGSLTESYLDEGYILPKAIGVGQSRKLENCKILIANTAMDADKIKIYGAKVKSNSMSNVIELEQAEKEKMKRKVDRICSSGCNVFINRLLIYNYPEQLFTEKGVLSIEHAEFDGIERLALVTGAEIVSEFGQNTNTKDDSSSSSSSSSSGALSVTLGTCKLIEEAMIGEDRVIAFRGLPNKGASTIVLRGVNKHVLDESERALHDALCVLQQAVRDHRVVYGGGCAEAVMAEAVEEEGKLATGKHRLAMVAFANALRQLPTHLVDNAGFDSQELVAKLCACHYAARKAGHPCDIGLDLDKGTVASMREAGVVEPVRVKLGVLKSAAEAAELILRVDSILSAAPRKREEQ